QTRGGTPATPTPPAAGGMNRAIMTVPGETEAGSAGRQPGRGIAWWAHRDDDRSAEAALLRSSQNHIGSVDPYALKIPARRAESCSLRRELALHFTLNRDIRLKPFCGPFGTFHI